MKYKTMKAKAKYIYNQAKPKIRKSYAKARPKIRRARKFSVERGMQINRELAKPIIINKRTTGI